MKATLLGVRQLNFTPRGQTEPVEGTQIYVAFPASGVTGQECKKLFVSAENSDMIGIPLPDFVGEEIEFDIGFNGKVVGISA